MMAMRLLGAFCCLLAGLVLFLLRPGTVQASGVQRSTEASKGGVPSTATLAGCQKSCGNLSIDYPFGIGSGCFRPLEFELICSNDSHSPTQAPRLFLHGGITEVISDISSSAGGNTDFLVAFSHVISLKPEIDVYNISWYPGKPFGFLLPVIILNFTGCNFDIYVLDLGTKARLSQCTVTCPNEDITDMLVARQNCNGKGCCSVRVETSVAAFQLMFVRRRTGDKLETQGNNNRSSMWDTIRVITDHAALTWAIAYDQNTYAHTVEKRRDYACLGNHSQPTDYPDTNIRGYLCLCEAGYTGNPYITDGCSRDKGFDPFQRKANCSRRCGNISVPFPFGLEDGCFARKSFRLNCTNATASTLQVINDLPGNLINVQYINIIEGLLDVKEKSSYGARELFYISGDPGLYTSSRESASVQWAVANLTCQEAQLNISGYACISINSTCLGVNNQLDGYPIGYRCKCMTGFDGNPYITNGCHDVDECETPGSCKGICYNTVGGYYCTECPGKTVYDTATMKCTSTKRQNLVEVSPLGLALALAFYSSS